MRKIAQVLKSNGVDGQLLVSFLGIDPEDIVLEEPVFIVSDGLPVPYFFESLTRRGTGRALVHLTGVHCLKDADELAGRAVYLDDGEQEEEGLDLTGWTLIDQEETVVGTVAGYEDIPGNPCLQVDTENGQALVPLQEELILSVDHEAREIRMEIPTGLLQL